MSQVGDIRLSSVVFNSDYLLERHRVSFGPSLGGIAWLADVQAALVIGSPVPVAAAAEAPVAGPAPLTHISCLYSICNIFRCGFCVNLRFSEHGSMSFPEGDLER